MLDQPLSTAAKPSPQDNVRYVGAINGSYALSGRRDPETDAIPVYACRLSSISPMEAVLIAPVIARENEIVAAHFKDFGVLRSRVSRELSTGFVLALDLDDEGRKKLAAKIRWKKQNATSHVPDKREFPRILPRMPRSVLTMADGSRMPCFVIDISQSGAAVSAAVLPAKGTPLAVGSMVGRVVRRLDIGFAVEFREPYPLEDLEQRLITPP